MGPDGPLGHIRTSGTTGTPNEWAAPALGVRVHDHYGQTETGRVINNHHDPRLAAPLKPGTMGRPMPGWTVRVLASDRDEPVPPGETGRIAVDLPAGPLAWFGGYDGGVDPGKFSADGRWYFSGEAGHVDDRGGLPLHRPRRRRDHHGRLQGGGKRRGGGTGRGTHAGFISSTSCRRHRAGRSSGSC
ncbi:AMP-binding protein [Amycolatopsis dongchuanensis]|uniref:AMP-dependent synthetase/ligase domain-containing protein n=1 Tax=Amycolatopsis dongchuanensis TaxID=1070866 RepID=A0ABP9QP16_9PSEU